VITCGPTGVLKHGITCLAKEIEGSERFAFLNAAEINLHRPLMLSDEITIKPPLLG
jgi:hypothetical protein